MGTVSRRDLPPWLILTATIAAAMLVVANVSALNVALPQLSRELGATQTDVHWMVDAYAVFLAALLLPAGAIGDRIGRRPILLLGLTVLVAANAAVLTMDSPLQVIIARGVSGIGAAFVFPATLSTITATLPDDQRARGVAMWTAAVSVGGIVGILGSGLLIESFWWGSVFLAMAGAALAVLALCWAFVPDSADATHTALDPLGAVLSAVAIGGLVLGIVEGPAAGWSSPVALTGLVVGGAALVAFVIWELRTPSPLLDLRLFAERGVRAGSLSIFVQFTAAFGFFFVAVFHLAYVLGYGPLDTGLGLLPISLGLLPASAVAIPLTRRFGRATMGVVGLLALASAFAVGTTIGVDSSFWLFAVVLALFGLGLGLSSPPATEAIVEALPPAKQGVASALNDVLREVGAAIGIAVVGASFNMGYRSAVDTISGLPPEVVDAVRESPAAAAVVAPGLGEAGPSLLAEVSGAVVAGWGGAMWILGAFTVAGAVTYLIWAPRRSPAVAPVAARPVAVSPVAGRVPVLGALEVGGPLGAIEIAAAAERELALLLGAHDALVASIAQFQARSAVPPDMETWPASHQTIVMERAALMLEEPVRALVAEAGELLARAQSCDDLIAATRAELRRCGRTATPLPAVDAAVVDAAGSAVAVISALEILGRRFDELAVVRSTLRPAAHGLREAMAQCRRAQAVIDAWPPTPIRARTHVDLTIDV